MASKKGTTMWVGNPHLSLLSSVWSSQLDKQQIPQGCSEGARTPPPILHHSWVPWRAQEEWVQGCRKNRAHLCLVEWQVLPCQQVTLHQMYTVINRGANEDGEGNGFHSSHFPARPVHDGHHKADNTCVRKGLLGKWRELCNWCTSQTLRSLWSHPTGVCATQPESGTHCPCHKHSPHLSLAQGPFHKITRPAGPSGSPS